MRLQMVELLAIVAYESRMPNRKTFDEREKVDHSSHPLMHRQPSDLKADIPDPKDEVATAPGIGELPERQISKRRLRPQHERTLERIDPAGSNTGNPHDRSAEKTRQTRRS
jgi:hypothetical protein